MSVMFETIHARSLTLAIAADALAPAAQGMFEGYDEAEIAGLTIHDGPRFERRPAARGNISRMIGQAKQECLRALRISFEEGDIDFDELLELYEVVDETAKELAWERWMELNPERDVDLDAEPEVIAHERIGWHGDREVRTRPLPEDWWAREDHGFRAIVPVGDCLGFGGVA